MIQNEHVLTGLCLSLGAHDAASGYPPGSGALRETELAVGCPFGHNCCPI
jgi:hypothetical protein